MLLLVVVVATAASAAAAAAAVGSQYCSCGSYCNALKASKSSFVLMLHTQDIMASDSS